jgi:ATP-dependent Clp protease ATP-binding subunit ClpC
MVLTLAQEEAQKFNHSYIGTEHILLGLLREDEGVGAKVLTNLDVSLSKVRSAVEFIIGRGEKPVTGEIGLTPNAKRVIELAIDEARHLGHSYIGTEHLLLGLLRERGGVAADVLDSFGITLKQARSETLGVVGEGVARPKPARSTSRTPVLDQLGIDLTALARAGKLEPVVERDSEVNQLVELLETFPLGVRQEKKSPLLVGDPSVDKLSIVEQLARRIATNWTAPLSLDT